MGIRLVVREAWSRQAQSEISYAFEQDRVVIGRGAGADVRLPHLTVSETHAILERRGDHYVVVDNSSTNGAKVNGSRIFPDRPKALNEGDLLQVGGYILCIHTSVVVAEPVSQERTSALARRLVRESLDPAAPSVPPPALVVVDGPQAGARLELPPPPGRALVGRAEHCQLALGDPEVLLEHLELTRDLDGVLARNLETTRATASSPGGVARRLRNGDHLLLGATTLRFEEPAEESIKALAGRPDERLPECLEASEPSAARSGQPDKGPKSADGGEDNLRRPSRKGGPRSSAQPSADLIIYVLAAIILASSMAGLLFLLRAG